MAFTAVDIESAGPSVARDSVIAVGLVTINVRGELMDCLVCSLPVPKKLEDWPHKESARFWSSTKNAKVLTQLERHQVKTEKELADQVRDYLDRQWKQYGFNHTVASNHSAYDLGFLNAILARHNHMDTSSDPNGRFQKCLDIDSFARGYALAMMPHEGCHILKVPMNEIHRRLGTVNPYPRNHFPISDAAHAAYDLYSLMCTSTMVASHGV